jgi:hypothetical protein
MEHLESSTDDGTHRCVPSWLFASGSLPHCEPRTVILESALIILPNSIFIIVYLILSRQSLKRLRIWSNFPWCSSPTWPSNVGQDLRTRTIAGADYTADASSITCLIHTTDCNPGHEMCCGPEPANTFSSGCLRRCGGSPFLAPPST